MKAIASYDFATSFFGEIELLCNSHIGSSLEGFSPQREFMKFWVAVIYCNDPPACEWVLVGYEPFPIFGLGGRVLISPVGSGWIKGDRISGYFTPRNTFGIPEYPIYT